MPTSPAETFGSTAISSTDAPTTPAMSARTASYSPIQWSYQARPPRSVHSLANLSIAARPRLGSGVSEQLFRYTRSRVIGNSERQAASCPDGLPADGIRLATWVGAAFERARLELADGAHPRGRGREVRQVAHRMSELREAVADLARDAALDREHSRLVRVRVERPWERARDDARRLDRRLEVHAEIDDVADRLHHRLALRVLARAAERHERAAILHKERWVRREARALARRDGRGMAGGGPQLRAPGAHDDAEAVDERRAKSGIGRRRRERVALRVHRAAVRRVRRADARRDARTIARGSGAALVAPGVAGLGQLRPRAIVADELAALLGVALVEHAADRDIELVRVAEESLAVRRRELERLGVTVQISERPRPHGGHVVALQQVERHRHERALRPRAAREDVDAAIGRVGGRLELH